MSDALAAVGGGAAPVPTRAAPRNDRIDQQQFLMLFIEQLKNQDPLSPLEPDQLTAQLAQFSSLEQLTGINTRLDQLTAHTTRNLGTTLLGLLGREVVYRSDGIRLAHGEATAVTFELPEEVRTLVATIRDAAGRTVRTVQLGARPPGEHRFDFDGRAAGGGRLPDGEYRVELTATVAGSEHPLVVPTRAAAVIDGIDLTQDPPALLAGGHSIPLDRLLRVRPSGGDPHTS